MYADQAINHFARVSTFCLLILSLSNFKVWEVRSMEMQDSCLVPAFTTWLSGSNSSNSTKSHLKIFLRIDTFTEGGKKGLAAYAKLVLLPWFTCDELPAPFRRHGGCGGGGGGAGCPTYCPEEGAAAMFWY